MTAEDKAKILRGAERHVLQGKIPQAIAEYQRLLRIDPADVLTLNTVGDLLLRQGRVKEANGYFSQVAEHFARHNFLHKAIAVYRKILRADPGNAAVSRTLAELYAQQGLNADARGQFEKVAELAEREGKPKEALEAYEKVAALDPGHVPVQLKLGEIFLRANENAKAHAYLSGAARAQAKAGNHAGAIVSFQRAMELRPDDAGVMASFLESCLAASNVEPALEQLRRSLLLAGDRIEFHEMLGRALIARGDLRSAEQECRKVVENDESRFPLFLEIQGAYLKAGELDAASSALDGIMPILIGRRTVEQAVAGYQAILESDPSHAPTWIRLAEAYSSTNDLEGHIGALERAAVASLGKGRPEEALPPLEKILLSSAGSPKHAELHREAFQAAFPGAPYAEPRAAGADSKPHGAPPPVALDQPPQPAPAKPGSLVEAELLVSYGLTEKALEMLQDIVAAEPGNREARLRLASLFKECGDSRRAAEQYLKTADLLEHAGGAPSAAQYREEAERLDPSLAAERTQERSTRAEPTIASVPEDPVEVDLSGDLAEMLFQEPPDERPSLSAAEETQALNETQYAAGNVAGAAAESLGDLLQEVDFYLRLGFHGEAKGKLDEIASKFPGSPELPSRYRQIEAAPSGPADTAADGSEARSETPADEDDRPHSQGLETDAAATGGFDSQALNDELAEGGRGREGHPGGAEPAELLEVVQEEVFSGGAGTPAGGQQETPVNEAFADLIEEVNSLADQETARDDFETHFNLGVVYREMELVDEAIREFQMAARLVGPTRYTKEIIRCCGLLSACFLEKEMPRAALRWCEAGLAVPGIGPEEEMALRYELGVAYSITGDRGRALEAFELVYRSDPGFRDVAERIDELRDGGEGKS